MDPRSQFYIAIWTKALGTVLGWPPERIHGWIEQFREQLNSSPSWLYHDGPITNIVPQFIPHKLRFRLDVKEENNLLARLERAMESAEPICPPDLTWKGEETGDLSSLHEWFVEYQAHREDLIRRNVCLSPTNIDAYDWSAAKARVEKILAEYGESLPDWDQEREYEDRLTRGLRDLGRQILERREKDPDSH